MNWFQKLPSNKHRIGVVLAVFFGAVFLSGGQPAFGFLAVGVFLLYYGY